MIRQALPSDITKVLDFCKNTFSWGDYIADVWNHWLSEGNLLVIANNKIPNGICHVSIIKNEQAWIEGIRVDKNFRRKGFAKRLIQESEKIAKENNCKTSLMLIATSNLNSLAMAKSLNYNKVEEWNFYSLLPKESKIHNDISFATKMRIKDIPLSSTPFYVHSWRWIPLSEKELTKLIEQKSIILSYKGDEVDSFAVITTSDHFDKTALITITFGDYNALKKILSFLQNYFFEKEFKRIQILSNLKEFPDYEGLENKFKFYLMKKVL